MIQLKVKAQKRTLIVHLPFRNRNRNKNKKKIKKENNHYIYIHNNNHTIHKKKYFYRKTNKKMYCSIFSFFSKLYCTRPNRFVNLQQQ